MFDFDAIAGRVRASLSSARASTARDRAKIRAVRRRLVRSIRRAVAPLLYDSGFREGPIGGSGPYRLFRTTASSPTPTAEAA